VAADSEGRVQAVAVRAEPRPPWSSSHQFGREYWKTLLGSDPLFRPENVDTSSGDEVRRSVARAERENLRGEIRANYYSEFLLIRQI
jgi:hypothetical protein